MLRASQGKLSRFTRDARGNVALLFALTLIPLLIGVGVAVDYGRALIVRERLQDAADAAGLAIGSWVGLTKDEMKVKAQQYFDANYPAAILGTVGAVNVSVEGSDIKVDVSGQVPTTFMQLANINTVDVGASATIAVRMGTVEVALALDNSGSMSGSKISSLRTAASDLVDTLFASAQNSPKPEPIKIAVVPFAASVNVGPENADENWMDKDGAGKYNAYETECYANGGTLNSSGVCSVSLSAPAVATNNFTLFSSLKDADGDPVEWAGCVEVRPSPYDTTDDAPGGATTLFVPMFAPDEPDNWTCSTGNCSYAGTSNSKRVYNGAPDGSQSYNNYLPDAGTPSTCAPEFPTVSSMNTSTDVITTSASAAPGNNMPVQFQSTGGLPGGLSSGTTYYVRSPSGKTFKVSTSSGGSAVNITSNGSGTIRYALAANWTCQSGDANCFGTNIGKSEESGFSGINVGSTAAAGALCKYGTPTNQAKIASIKVSNYDAGPNFLCTTKPILSLSTDKATVKARIAEMGAKGMTSIGEGAAWGWRTLSPGSPFTEGRPYGAEENQKVLVLMTDGQNTNTPNSKFLKSQYGAFGYVARGQLGTTSTNSSTLTAAMDARTLQICNNIKAAGIIVYTVAFQIPSDEADALTLLQNCATDSDKYFAPNTESDLLNAFNAIGKDISMLRISQ
jgi:Flp pilus assembly protein TadG